jgi:HK97 family phage major capsid protein
MSKLSDLIQQKSSLIANATEMVQRGLKTAEDKAAYNKVLASVDEADEMITMLKRVENVLPKSAPVPTAPAASRGGRESKKVRRAKINAAFRSYLQGQNTPEVRALIDSTDGLLPQEFSGVLTEALKTYFPVLSYANVVYSSRSIKATKVDDTANGLTLIATEGDSLIEADPTFASILVDLDNLSLGIVKFSNEILSDSHFDLEKLLTNLLSSRYGRGLEKAVTLGTDSAGTALPNSSGGLVTLAHTATTTATTASSIGWADLVATYDALDPAYLPRAIFQMSSKTRNYLAGLKTSDGRPYFTPNPISGGLDSILGCDVVINQSLASPTAGVFAANSKPILFGDMNSAVQVVTSGLRIQPLFRQRFGELNMSAITGYTRVGVGSLQPGALQALKIAAA